MKTDAAKLVLVPVDGSLFSLKSLNYIHTLFGTDSPLKIALIYILPALPPILVEESRRNVTTAKQLKVIEEKNLEAGRRILDEAQDLLVSKGFKADAFDKLCESKKVGVARDINACVEKRLADALVVSSSGKGRLEGFFMGEVSNKLVEMTRVCPVWVVKGDVTSDHVLIAIDGSENSLRSVDHAGYILSAAGGRITLFHSPRNLNRFLPRAVFEDLMGLEDTLRQETEKSIQPAMNQARDMLIRAGVDTGRIEILIGDGERRPAKGILQQARASGAGSVILGRRGTSDVSDYPMGSITRKVINEAENLAVWIVS